MQWKRLLRIRLSSLVWIVVHRLAILFFLASFLAYNGLAHGDKLVCLKAGDPILLDLAGKPATSCLNLFEQPVPDGPFGVPLELRIVSIDGNRLVAEYQVMVRRNSQEPRIVTVTVSFNRDELVDPGPSDYRPLRPKPATAREKLIHESIQRLESLPRIRKDTFDGLRIRIWSLSREIAK